MSEPKVPPLPTLSELDTNEKKWTTPHRLPPHLEMGCFYLDNPCHQVNESDFHKVIGCREDFCLYSDARDFNLADYEYQVICMRGEYKEAKDANPLEYRSEHDRQFWYEFVIIIQQYGLPFFMFGTVKSTNDCDSCDGTTDTTSRFYYDDQLMRLLEFACKENTKQTIMGYLETMPEVRSTIRAAEQDIIDFYVDDN